MMIIILVYGPLSGHTFPSHKEKIIALRMRKRDFRKKKNKNIFRVTVVHVKLSNLQLWLRMQRCSVLCASSNDGNHNKSHRTQ